MCLTVCVFALVSEPSDSALVRYGWCAGLLPRGIQAGWLPAERGPRMSCHCAGLLGCYETRVQPPLEINWNLTMLASWCCDPNGGWWPRTGPHLVHCSCVPVMCSVGVLLSFRLWIFQLTLCIYFQHLLAWSVTHPSAGWTTSIGVPLYIPAITYTVVSVLKVIDALDVINCWSYRYHYYCIYSGCSVIRIFSLKFSLLQILIALILIHREIHY